MRTSVDVDSALWRIVRIRANRDGTTLMDALEQILHDFIKDHGKEYGYPPEQIKGR